MKSFLAAGQIFFLLVLIGQGVFGYPVNTGSQTVPPVMINELMWMGSSASSSDEWIELRNLSNETVDLSGWLLTRKSNNEDVPMLTFPEGSVIGSEEFFLVSNYSAEQSVLAIEPDLVDSAVSLVNSKLQIKLWNALGELMDTADDGSGQPLAGHYVSGSSWHSMERNWEYADGTLPTSWHSAEITYNFDPGATELGTPRWQNTDPNFPPTASILAEESAEIGQSIAFDGSESSDPDGDELSFHWDFGDGTVSTIVTPTHVYRSAGEHEVVLVVSDGQLEDDTLITVTINEAKAEPPAPQETTPETPEPTTARIILNEVFPNPEGSDVEEEFIELYNPETEDVSLSGWKIGDASRSHTIKASDGNAPVIESGGLFLLPRPLTSIALNNNSAETITLTRPDGIESDSISYQPPVPEGRSYSRIAETWNWTLPSPGATNVLEQEAPEDEEEEIPAAENFTPDLSDRVIITELLPNPEGPDADAEFIEVANFDDREVNLQHWQLTDKSTYYQIEEALVLAPGEYAIFERQTTKIALNNSAEEIFLIDPKGVIRSGVNYTAAPEAASWSRHESSDNWSWTTDVTPEQANRFSSQEIVSESEEESEIEGPLQIPIREARQLELRQLVMVEGSVVVEPGILGSQFFYINDADSGIQIYSSKSDFPDFSAGDLVRVTGKTGQSQGEHKINIQSADDVSVLGPGEVVAAVEIAASDIGKNTEGRLAVFSGTVKAKRGSTLTLDKDGIEAAVFLKRNIGVSTTEYSEGDHLTVTGIVGATTEGHRLLPRWPEDIVKGEVLAATTVAEEPKSPSTEVEVQTLTANSNSKALYSLLSVCVAAAGYGGFRFWQHRKKKSTHAGAENTDVV